VKLIFIYGPPAVGKLTIATELGRLTSFAVFDNHLSIDCVLPVFGYGTSSLNKLSEFIRLAVIEEAAREDVDLIYTVVFAYPEDVSHVERICEAVEPHGGSVCLIQLTCSAEVQEERVLSADRARRKKTRSVDLVRDWNGRYDLVTPIPERPSLRIDNTALSPSENSRKIAEHYGLAAAPRE
jgi:hypothetical protein